MRTIRISWKKAFICVAACAFTLYFIGPFFLPAATSTSSLADELKSAQYKKRENPVFNEDGSLGNFEKSESSRSGPGEMGKPHRVKPEQKGEEDRLKGLF